MPERRIDVNDMTPFPTLRPSGESRNPARARPAETSSMDPGFRRGDENGGRTLRKVADLADAGFISPERVAALEEVAARYAVAITPAMTRLIDVDDPAD